MKKSNIVVAGIFSAGLALGGSAYLVGRATGAGVPADKALTYSGVLTDAAGAPLTGTKNVQITIATDDGSKKCDTGPLAQALVGGAFQMVLHADCTKLVQDYPDLNVEVFVDGGSTSKSKLGAVPFALEAKRASAAAGALDTRIVDVETRLKALEVKNTGTLAGMWWAAPTACVSIKNSAWVDVTDTAVKITLDKPAMVFSTYSININPGGVTGPEYAATRLVVDDVPITASGSHFQPFTNNDPNVNLNGNYVGELATGQHTIKLQWRTEGGSAQTWSNCPATWADGSLGGRTLVVQAFHK